VSGKTIIVSGPDLTVEITEQKIAVESSPEIVVQVVENPIVLEVPSPSVVEVPEQGPAGPEGPPGPVGPEAGKPLITRLISENLTVEAGKTCVQNGPTIALDVSVTIEATGRLYIL
jgi:hypothetical protein